RRSLMEIGMSDARASDRPAVRIELETERAWCGERLLDLAPKAFAILRHFVEHPERLLTKDDLFAAVWGDTVVSEAALTSCIRDLRRAPGRYVPRAALHRDRPSAWIPLHRPHRAGTQRRDGTPEGGWPIPDDGGPGHRAGAPRWAVRDGDRRTTTTRLRHRGSRDREDDVGGSVPGPARHGRRAAHRPRPVRGAVRHDGPEASARVRSLCGHRPCARGGIAAGGTSPGETQVFF